MIDENKIAKAARQISENVINSKGFNDSKPTHLAFLDGHIDGFKQGAKWAINEFLKDLWHPAWKVPEDDRYILLEEKYSDAKSIMFYDAIKYDSCYEEPWDSKSARLNITRWLYIDDLLLK